MKTVNVYIVRHGETIFNTLDKLQGWADSPLTDKVSNLPLTQAIHYPTSILILLTLLT